MSFLPKNTKIWIKDVQLTLDTIDKYLDTARTSFDNILDQSNRTQVILDPINLFETQDSFMGDLEAHDLIEFGNRFYFKSDASFSFKSEPQPSFNKNFELISENLDEHQRDHYKIVIASDSFKQLDQLTTIFEEIDPTLQFEPLNISLRNGFVDHDTDVSRGPIR